MRMIDISSERNAMQIIDRTTSVDCEKDVRCWPRSLKSLVEFMVPCCGCQSMAGGSVDDPDTESTLGSTVTGTIFGYRKGRVSFCIQEDRQGPNLLLLEFAMPTYLLAKEMQYGLLRIALECDKENTREGSLFSVPVWTMYCNGRKAGFAIRRHVTENDRAILKVMQCISVGAGVLPYRETKADEGELMYMRATYERVVGSSDSESFHMINPDGSTGQQLSIFLLRS
ncbi:protein MIZU-KUSSEI 1 [Cryptomeria japonica]|uniref:protein MIZU-KUSSEI 1 n=1 Tax=Cryptomeria japonica TaxID=3369 RepID=UPI0025ACCAD4|nr:protein MIZU-KUSSEI 1 [Cryptomeria japonica]XP_057829757.1 protein MIZU-KUSSEI 1 [Cryptomeria japonica]